MCARRWYIAAFGIVVVIAGYSVVNRLMTPVPPRFDQPWQSPSYSYGPASNAKAITGAEEGFIHTKKHGDTTSLAVWANSAATSSGRRDVSPGYTSGRLTDQHGNVTFQWKARLKNQFDGVLSIEQHDYRLSEGRLFLVALDASPIRILQLDRELAGMTPSEIHERFAKDPAVIRFFDPSSKR